MFFLSRCGLGLRLHSEPPPPPGAKWVHLEKTCKTCYFFAIGGLVLSMTPPPPGPPLPKMSGHSGKRTDVYSAEREEKYCIVDWKGKYLHLLWSAVVNWKKLSIERDFQMCHGAFAEKFQLDPEAWTWKISRLKSDCVSQRSQGHLWNARLIQQQLLSMQT